MVESVNPESVNQASQVDYSEPIIPTKKPPVDSFNEYYDDITVPFAPYIRQAVEKQRNEEEEKRKKQSAKTHRDLYFERFQFEDSEMKTEVPKDEFSERRVKQEIENAEILDRRVIDRELIRDKRGLFRGPKIREDTQILREDNAKFDKKQQELKEIRMTIQEEKLKAKRERERQEFESLWKPENSSKPAISDRAMRQVLMTKVPAETGGSQQPSQTKPAKSGETSQTEQAQKAKRQREAKPKVKKEVTETQSAKQFKDFTEDLQKAREELGKTNQYTDQTDKEKREQGYAEVQKKAITQWLAENDQYIQAYAEYFNKKHPREGDTVDVVKAEFIGLLQDPSTRMDMLIGLEELYETAQTKQISDNLVQFYNKLREAIEIIEGGTVITHNEVLDKTYVELTTGGIPFERQQDPPDFDINVSQVSHITHFGFKPDESSPREAEKAIVQFTTPVKKEGLMDKLKLLFGKVSKVPFDTLKRPPKPYVGADYKDTFLENENTTSNQNKSSIEDESTSQSASTSEETRQDPPLAEDDNMEPNRNKVDPLTAHYRRQGVDINPNSQDPLTDFYKELRRPEPRDAEVIMTELVEEIKKIDIELPFPQEQEDRISRLQTEYIEQFTKRNRDSINNLLAQLRNKSPQIPQNTSELLVILNGGFNGRFSITDSKLMLNNMYELLSQSGMQDGETSETFKQLHTAVEEASFCKIYFPSELRDQTRQELIDKGFLSSPRGLLAYENIEGLDDSQMQIDFRNDYRSRGLSIPKKEWERQMGYFYSLQFTTHDYHVVDIVVSDSARTAFIEKTSNLQALEDELEYLRSAISSGKKERGDINIQEVERMQYKAVSIWLNQHKNLIDSYMKFISIPELEKAALQDDINSILDEGRYNHERMVSVLEKMYKLIPKDPNLNGLFDQFQRLFVNISGVELIGRHVNGMSLDDLNHSYFYQDVWTTDQDIPQGGVVTKVEELGLRPLENFPIQYPERKMKLKFEVPPSA